jgi:hypothetical protein
MLGLFLWGVDFRARRSTVGMAISGLFDLAASALDHALKFSLGEFPSLGLYRPKKLYLDRRVGAGAGRATHAVNGCHDRQSTSVQY